MRCIVRPPPFSIASQGRSVHRSQGCRHAPPRGAHRRLNRPHCTRSINSEKHQGAQMLSLRLTSSSPPRHSCLGRHSCRTTRRTVRRIAGTSPTYRASSAMPSALYEEQKTPNHSVVNCNHAPAQQSVPHGFPAQIRGPVSGYLLARQDPVQVLVRHRGHGWSKRFLVTHLALERVTWATRAPTAHFPRQFCASAGHVRWGQCPKTAQVRGCPASYPGAPTTEGPFAQMSRAPTS